MCFLNAATRLGLLLAVVLLGELQTKGQNVIAWGSNAQGQTNVPPSATNVLSVAAGWYHSMALRADGSVVTWGTIASTPNGVSNITSIAAGVLHCLALRADGTVLAWGDNSQGQLNVPSSASNVVAVSAGYFHNLALRADGTVVAWGRNVYGQTNVPVGLSNVVAVAAGSEQSIAVLNNNSLVIWGGSTVYPFSLAKSYPTSFASNIVAIAAGPSFNLTLRAAGSIYAWGVYPWSAASVKPPSIATNIVAIAAGTNFNLSLRSDGRIIAWGTGTVTNTPGSATNVTAIAVGLSHGLAVTGSGAPVICEPTAYQAQCMVGDRLPLAVLAVGAAPLSYQWLANGVAIPGATNALPMIYGALGSDAVAYQVVVSNAFGSATSSIVNVSIASVNIWGSDVDHQCDFPSSLGNPLRIAAGEFHNLALKGNGTVVAWGRNEFGQTNVPSSATNVIGLAAGGNHSLALRNDGSVVAWGYNSDGQTSVPASATNVIAVGAGYAYSVALRADGSVVAWATMITVRPRFPSKPTRSSPLPQATFIHLGCCPMDRWSVGAIKRRCQRLPRTWWQFLPVGDTVWPCAVMEISSIGGTIPMVNAQYHLLPPTSLQSPQVGITVWL